MATIIKRVATAFAAAPLLMMPSPGSGRHCARQLPLSLKTQMAGDDDRGPNPSLRACTIRADSRANASAARQPATVQTTRTPSEVRQKTLAFSHVGLPSVGRVSLFYKKKNGQSCGAIGTGKFCSKSYFTSSAPLLRRHSTPLLRLCPEIFTASCLATSLYCCCSPPSYWLSRLPPS